MANNLAFLQLLNHAQPVKFPILSGLNKLNPKAIIVTISIAVATVSPLGCWYPRAAFAENLQPSAKPQTPVKTPATLLKGEHDSINVDCLLAEDMGVQPEHCSSHGSNEIDGLPTLNPDSLQQAETDINQQFQSSGRSQPPDQLPKPLLRFPL